MSPHAAPAADVPTAQSKGERSLTRWTAAGLLALMLCARLPAYLVNENLVGDAVARTDLALTWADSPHWISSFADGALQFGPLHLYVLGAALKLGVSKAQAGPLTSLLFGTLTVLPLAALSGRLFGRTAAVWSGVGLALWGLHIQISTTGASEALSLFLVLSALALFDAGDVRRLAASGLVLTLACAVRFDTWMLAPLLAFLAACHGKERLAALKRAAVFGLCCLPFPLAWLYGSWRELGDPLYSIRYVEAFHRDWVPAGVRAYGEARFRAQSLLFWPGTAVLSLGPLLAAAGFAGMGWAFRARPEVRWLLWAAWAPAAYFTVRGAVLMDFHPLARFTMGQVVLLLPFLKPGADVLLRRLPARVARAAPAVGAASLVALGGWLAAYTTDNPDHFARELLSLSPLSRNTPEVRRAVALFGAQGADPEDVVLVDADPGGYQDMQVAFFLRHPWRQVVRRRWKKWTWELEQRRPGGAPEWIIRFEGGPLESTPEVEVGGPGLHFRGRGYDEVPGGPPGIRLYRARR